MAIESAEGQALLAAVPQERRLASAHAVTPDGRVASAGDAAAPIAAVLPGGSVVASVLRALGPVPRVAYAAIAGNRSRLGRLVSPAMRRRADALIAERTRAG